MASSATTTAAPTPIKAAKKAKTPLTRAEAAQKIAAICKRLSPEDSMKVLDTVRSIVSL